MGGQTLFFFFSYLELVDVLMTRNKKGFSSRINNTMQLKLGSEILLDSAFVIEIGMSNE